MRLQIHLILILVLFIVSCVKDQNSPVAKFTVTPLTGDVGESFNFNSGMSYDQKDHLSDLKFRWDWEGDGFWDTPYSSETIINQKFQIPGTYKVHLEVINKGGITGISFREIVVMDKGPLYPPIIIYPSNEKNNIKISSLISWDCYHADNLDLKYDLYFGITSNPPLIKKNSISDIYDPGMLNSSTTYYWKVTAKDNNGNISTSPVWSFSTNLFDERDNQSYQIIKIGGNDWMAENLNFKSDSGSWCYRDDSINCDLYGKLYNWETAINSCPNGWHLPSEVEWMSLELAFYIYDANDWESRGEELANILREGGSSGFNVLLAGTRDFRGRYSILGTDCGFWTSSGDEGFAKYRYFFYDPPYIFRTMRVKQDGLSVRCIKDKIE